MIILLTNDDGIHAEGINLLFEQLSKKARALAPGQSGLVALDWLNGARSVLMNGHLSGMVAGFARAETTDGSRTKRSAMIGTPSRPCARLACRKYSEQLGSRSQREPMAGPICAR